MRQLQLQPQRCMIIMRMNAAAWATDSPWLHRLVLLLLQLAEGRSLHSFCVLHGMAGWLALVGVGVICCSARCIDRCRSRQQYD